MLRPRVVHRDHVSRRRAGTSAWVRTVSLSRGGAFSPHARRGARSSRPSARMRSRSQGGTDVMVELNFDRARPETMLNLSEVARAAGWSRENGTVRLGAGLTYTEAMAGELAELLPALAEASRTVGSPQIRNRGTSAATSAPPRPRGTRFRRCSSRAPRSSWRARRRRGRCRCASSSSAPSGTRSGGRARRRRAAAPTGGAADLHEGRAAERHGDRGVLARARGRPGAGRAARRVRLGRAGARLVTAPLDERDAFPGASRTRRARSTTSAARPRTGATRCACSTERALERCLA